MTIQTFPRKEVVTIDPETPVTDVAERMDREDIGFVVVTDDGKPTGTISDRDLAMGVAGDGQDADALDAGDVMNEAVVPADADADIFEVIEAMSEAGVRRLVAVDEDGTADAIVTLDDFVVLLARELGHLSDVVESQVPEYEKSTGERIAALDGGTDGEPADLVTFGAAVSVLLSLYVFFVRGNENQGIFIGHWAPTILAFATYLRDRRSDR